MSDIQLLLLPGLDGTGSLFDPFLSGLPPEVRATVVAYPRSGVFDPLTYENRILDSCQEPDATVVIAESFSSRLLLRLLQRTALRPKAAVFCSGVPRSPIPLLWIWATILPLGWMIHFTSWQWVLRFFLLDFASESKLVHRLQESILRVEPRTIHSRITFLSRDQSFKSMPLDVPCLILQPTKDRLVSVHEGDIIGSFFKDLVLRYIEGPHLLLQTRPSECIQQILTFIKELPMERPSS